VHETLSDPSAVTPSVNAMATAQALSGLGRLYNRPPKGVEPPPDSAALGALVGDGVRVHSSVSPALVSHQEVRCSLPSTHSPYSTAAKDGEVGFRVGSLLLL
jgi:hypothetical protein